MDQFSDREMFDWACFLGGTVDASVTEVVSLGGSHCPFFYCFPGCIDELRLRVAVSFVLDQNCSFVLN